MLFDSHPRIKPGLLPKRFDRDTLPKNTRVITGSGACRHGVGWYYTTYSYLVELDPRYPSARDALASDRPVYEWMLDPRAILAGAWYWEQFGTHDMVQMTQSHMDYTAEWDRTH